MEHYAVLPVDWDYKQSKTINEYQKKGCWTPCDIEEVVGSCGSLWPYITTKTSAIRYVKGLKKKFPFVAFVLFRDNPNGEREVVQNF